MTAGYTVSEKKKSLTNTEGRRTYGRLFQIVNAANLAGTVTESTIEALAEIPNVGSVHPNNASAYCKSVSIDGGLKNTWTAKCVFEELQNALDETPTSDEVIVTTETEGFEEAIYEDTSGDAFLNSAGDPVEGITRESSHLVFKIQANVAAEPAYMVTHRDAVNDATITIRGYTILAGFAKVRRMALSEGEGRNGTDFFKFTAEVHYHEKGWKVNYLDAGKREKIDDLMVDITNDGDGSKVTDDVPLNGSGRVLANPTPSTVTNTEKSRYVEKDLTDLPGIT